MTLDRLTLKGILCRCRIGVTEEERRDPQKIELDIDLWADLEEAGRTGNLARTIDYRQVCDEARGLLESGSYHLVEAAAKDVVDRMLSRFQVHKACVRVRKFVLQKVDYVEVEMERGR